MGNHSQVASLVNCLIKESQEFREQLIREVVKKGGAALSKATGNTGRVYNSWKELRTWLLQKKDLSILEMVQFDTKAA